MTNASLPVDHSHLLALARDLDMEDDGPLLVSLAALTLVADEVEASPSPGASRLGGIPDLSPEVEWPSIDGAPLTFVAQLDLASLPEQSLLPRRGVLSFFLGKDEPSWAVAHRVLFFEGDPASLAPRPPPSPEVAPYSPVGLTFRVATSLPGGDRERYPEDTCGTLDLFMEEVERQKRWTDRRLWLSGTKTRMFGHPEGWHEDPRSEAWILRHRPGLLFHTHETPAWLDDKIAAARANGNEEEAEKLEQRRGDILWYHSVAEERRAEIERWELLLQVGSSRRAGMCWWDAGLLVFYGDIEAMRRGDFSGTYASIASS